MSFTFLYITGSLIVSSIMMWWFNTNLPIHVVQLLHMLGYKKDDESFWYSETPIEFWTKTDLDAWKIRVLPAWLDELSACPGCLSMHISFWVSIFITLITWQGYTSVVFFFTAWGGWPYLGNLALNKLNNK